MLPAFDAAASLQRRAAKAQTQHDGDKLLPTNGRRNVVAPSPLISPN